MKKEVLVIEDNLEVRMNLCEILELADYKVRSAENGKVGVKMVKEKRPDLILCDVMMPELDGYGVLKILNDNQSLRFIPFLFLSAKMELDDIRKGMGLGADDYITKPFDDVQLLEAIKLRLEKAKRPELVSRKLNISSEDFLKEISELVDEGERREFENKQLVFLSGNLFRSVGYLQEGMLRRYKTNFEGKEFTTELIGPKEIFGWELLFSNSPEMKYTYSVSALGNCKVVLINKNKFLDRISVRPIIKDYLLREQNRLITALESELVQIAYFSVRQKVAKAVLKCSENNESIDLSRELLATIAGTAKESVIRTLSEFKSDDLIKIDSKSIVVLNRSALLEMMQN